MRRRKYIGVALIGLLVVAAISVAAGSGRKPVTESPAAAMRMLSDAEVAQVSQRFPNLGSQISQLSSELLEHLFPNTQFYKAISNATAPSIPYLNAVGGDSLIPMPDGFDHLLQRYSMSVNNDNIIELAKTFVLLAVGDEDFRTLDTFPPLVFLEAKRIKQTTGSVSCEAELKVRVGEHVEEWYFDSRYGHLSDVERRFGKGPVKLYMLGQIEPPPARGQLNQALQETKP